MSAEPDDYSDFDDFCESAEDDEFEDAAMNCGLTPSGQCMLAGTEHCDFECPMRDSAFFAPFRKRPARRRQHTDADKKYLAWKAAR